MKFKRLDKTKGSGAPSGGRYAYLLCVDDIDYFPPTDEKGVRLLGDIVMKPDTEMMPVYISNSSKEYSYDSTGDDDEKSYIVKFSGTHPGTELEALEFAKNKLEESYIILIPSCTKDEPWKLLGEMLNPLIFTSSHKAANTGSKFTFNFEQRIGSEFLYFLYGGIVTAPADPGTPTPSNPGSGFDPTKWARIDASNIDEHVQAWRDKLNIQVDFSGLKEKSEDNWKDINTGSTSSFSISYSDSSTRFRINTTTDIPKTLTDILFSAETGRAVEFIIFNNTNLNVKLDQKDTDGLRKGFSALNMPFIILPKSEAMLKYNPQTNLIEAWKVNTPGFAYPAVGNNGDVLEKDSTSSSGAKWSNRLTAAQTGLDAEIVNRAIADTNLQTQINAEIANRSAADISLQGNIDAEIVNRAAGDNNLQGQVNAINARTSSLVDKMLHYWDATAGKWLSSGMAYINGKIGIGTTSPAEALDVNGRVRTNSIVLASDIGTAVPNELGKKSGFLCLADSSGILRYYSAGSKLVYTPNGNFLLSTLKAAVEAEKMIFNSLIIYINIGTNNYTCTIDNGAANPNTSCVIIRSGTGSLSFSSNRTLDSGPSNIVILNGNQSSFCVIQLLDKDYVKIKNY
jgi:hypothetical protein